MPDRLHPDLLGRHAPTLIDFLDRGRTLVVLGEPPPPWAPGSFVAPDQFLVVAGEGAQPPHKILHPEHTCPVRSVRGHAMALSGVLFPPPGADALILVPADAGRARRRRRIALRHRATTRGRIILSTLDPFYHHGSNFMPATTRFLDGFLPWARANAAI